MAPSTRFAAGGHAPNAVRLSLGAPESAAQLETALNVVMNLLARVPRAGELATV